MEILKLNGDLELTVAVMPWGNITIPNAVIMSESVARSSAFTSIETRKIKVQITPHKNEYLCNPDELPNISEATAQQLAKRLDERGIIRVGQTVNYNDIIVSKIIKDSESTDAADKLVAAIFGGVDRNISEKFTFQDPGIVVDVEYHLDNFQNAQVIVYVAIKRPIRVGDVLHDQKGNEVVLAGIIPDKQLPKLKGSGDKKINAVITSPSKISTLLTNQVYVEDGYTLSVVHSLENPGFVLIAPKREKNRKNKKWEYRGEKAVVGNLFLQKKAGLLEHKVGGFGISDSLLVSKQLLEGLKISQNLIGILQLKGLHTNVRELLSIKSDDRKGYSSAIDAMVRGMEFPTTIAPASLQRMKILLQSFCFRLTVDEKVLRISFIQNEEMNFYSGKVTSPEIFYNRSQPKDGLLCEKIFGPITDWTCACKKYRSIRYKGIVCNKCGVEVASSDVRFNRFGYIDLAVPVIHPFLQKEVAAFIEKFSENVSDDETLSSEFTKNPCEFVQNYLQTTIGSKCNISKLPVLPAGYRSHFVNGKLVTTSDLNDLYRRVIIRNQRLTRLIEAKVPTVILTNEIRMLQESVRDLFLGLRYSSIDQTMRGLIHDFAETNELLFNKKVSYSAKGVVVPNATISPDVCVLPQGVALKMFEPFVCSKLMDRKRVVVDAGEDEQDREREPGPAASTLRQATWLIKNKKKVAIDVLPEITKDRFVLVCSTKQNEVFAFKPVIGTENEVIQLHPSAIERLGIALDKNRYAMVHLPLSSEAQIEASQIVFTEDDHQLVQSKFNSGLQLNLRNLCEIASGKKSGEIIPTEFDKVLLNLV